jgi:hypothetical protein
MVLRSQYSDSLLLLIALALRLASGPTANLSYLLIVVYSLKGYEHALQALFFSWLFSMLNSAIAPDASVATIGRYAVLVAAAISVWYRKDSISFSKSDLSFVRFTIVFGVMIVIHSVLFSSMPDVSVLKAISWTVAMTVLLVGWAGLKEDARQRMNQQLFAGLTLLMLASLPLLAFPAAYIGGVGFMGVLGHTQSFGMTMALLGAWASVRAFAAPQPPWPLISMIPVCLGLIIMSGARTAALALLLGVAASMLLGSKLSGQPSRIWLPGLRNRRVQIAIFLVLVGATAAWPGLVQQSKTFIEKNTESVNVLQAYQISRGGLIDAMWANIEKSPWQGIGFGIATIPELMDVKRDPVFDLPISALVEKGVLPIAVLEELGVVGFLFFVVWLLNLLKRCARRGVPALAVFLVAVLLNMGEAILFSAGGMGMLAMMLIAWAATGKPVMTRRP